MKTHLIKKIWVIGLFFVFLGTSATVGAMAGGMWSDNFDSYANDQFLDGGADDGGWNGWGYSPAAGAYVRDDYSFSSPHSVEIAGATDLVHEFTGYNSGIWPFETHIYLPVNFSGTSYFILLSGYDGGGSGTNWAAQVRFDGDLGIVESEFTGEQAPLIYGEWVQFECRIDLDSDWLQIFYNGTLLAEHAYSDTVQGTGGGPLNIAAIDLFANGASSVYYDDIWLPYWYEPLMCNAGGPYSGETGQAIQFNGSARFGTQPYTWLWDFGDGAIASVQNPTHAYSVVGNYTATLTVTDAESATASDTAPVTIFALQPVLEIGTIDGGFGVKSSVKNTGAGAASNVEWSISLDGKLVFVGKSSSGSFATIAPAGKEPIKAGFILGLGKTNITVSATCDEGVMVEANASGSVLGPFVLRVK